MYVSDIKLVGSAALNRGLTGRSLSGKQVSATRGFPLPTALHHYFRDHALGR